MPDSTTTTTAGALPAVITEAASAPPTPGHQALFREAFARQLPAMMLLTAEQLLAVNLDLLSAVITVLGAWSEIRAMRPQIARELPFFDLATFDLIEEFALAAGHAQLEFASASASSEELQQLNVRATELRDLFLSDIRALVKRKLVKAEQVSDFKGLFGYKHVAFELLGLTVVARQVWPVISDRTAIEPAELDEAERLVRRMASAIGEREQGPAQVAEPAQVRQRAFTLLVSAYDDARRAISYLRWHEGDVDTIAPSLYAKHGGSQRKDRAADDDKEPAAKPTPVAQPAPVDPTRRDGMPGGSPFL